MRAKSMDITLDLETTGTSPGCCVLSIGACSTNMEFEFYQPIWYSSQKAIYGLKDCPETLRWWDKQNKEARDEAFSGTAGLQVVLGNFADWLKSLPANEVFVWGNGADFDQPILSYAYEVAGMDSPFRFNNRCYRTLKNLYKNIKAPIDFEGIKHHALWDAKHEARHLSALLRYHFQGLSFVNSTPVFQD